MKRLKHGKPLRVVFKQNNRYYRLCNIIQMRKDGIIDLKITDCFDGAAILTKTNNPHKGYLTEDELRNAKVFPHLEMSYHPNGAYLYKLNSKSKLYINPYGEGELWIPTYQIEDFQPIMVMFMHNTNICGDVTDIVQKHKNNVYSCENDNLFNNKGQYFLIFYIRNKQFFVHQITNATNIYSDIIGELNDDCDLCIVIQRYTCPPPQSYYSESDKNTAMPWLNSVSFCDKETSKPYMNRVYKNTIFNPYNSIE